MIIYCIISFVLGLAVAYVQILYQLLKQDKERDDDDE